MIAFQELTFNFWYILGALKGDGHIAKQGRRDQGHFYFTTTDITFARNFERSLRTLRTGVYSKIRIFTERKPLHCLSGYNGPLCRFYHEANLSDWFDVRPDTLIPFTKGFFEAEGSLWQVYDRHRWGPYYRVEMSNSDMELLSILKEQLNAIGYGFKLYGPRFRNERIIAGKPVTFSKPTYRLALNKQEEVKDFIRAINPCIPRKRLGDLKEKSS